MADPNTKEELTVPDGLLDNIERDFNEAMEALDAEESMRHYRLEYERMYRSLKRSHESEKRLVDACQELTQELLSNAAKMQAAMKLSQGDHSTIEALKKEIEKAWRAVDSANDKDLRARETIATLQQEIEALQSLVKDGSSLSTDHTSTLEQLKLERRRLELQLEEAQNKTATYTAEIIEMTEQEKALLEAAKTKATDLDRLRDRLDLANQECQRERNARTRSEVQSRDLLVSLQTREKELRGREEQQKQLEESIAALRAQVSADEQKRDTLRAKVETSQKQLFHTKQTCHDSVDTTAELNERLSTMDKNIKACERKIGEAEKEAVRIQRIKDSDFKELQRLKDQNAHVKKEMENIQRQKTLLMRRIATVDEETANIKQGLELLRTEQEVLKRKGEKELHKQQEVEALISRETMGQKELEEEIAREKATSLRLQAVVEKLEREREQCVAEVSQIAVQHQSAEQEARNTALIAADTQRRIEESEARLNKQQGTYEQIRTERNQLSRKLAEAHDEIVELKQKFKVMDQQVVQLKEELTLRERRRADEEKSTKNAGARLAKAQKEVNQCTATFEEVQGKCAAISLQISQLVKVIRRCDADMTAQQTEIARATANRDLLSEQVRRRNDETELLNERLRLLQEAMNRGEGAFRDRIDDARLLRLKRAEIRRQAVLAKTRASDVQELKGELRRLERDLAEEQAKSAALASEVEDPKNVDRWRLLEGTDPTPEELEAKIHSLQLRLIAKTEQSLEKQMELEEKERAVTELQTILARQPGAEVAQQLNVYQKELQKRNAKMRVKASELNMTSTHIAELKYESERLRRDVGEMRSKYYDIKVKTDTLLASPDEDIRAATA